MVDLLRRSPRVAPDGVDWQFIHFEAHQLSAGERCEGNSGTRETALVVLGGQARIKVGKKKFEISGRKDVWERRAPSLVLLPPGHDYAIEAKSEAEIVIASADAEAQGKPRLIGPDDILVEERGAGQTLRYVHHLLPPSAEAQRLTLVEVYTPPGNWSSFPPHKHDTDDPPREADLEEIYYFRYRDPNGYGFQRVYTQRRDDTLRVTHGDVVAVRDGFHPFVTAYGYDAYYLNVLAGGRVRNFGRPAYAS
jgi:5-deoxy-glucuronate isomerase